jgi:thiamine biosynthesis lipoprotein
MTSVEAEMTINWSKRQTLRLLGGLVLVPALPGEARDTPPALIGSTMGTTYRIQLGQFPDTTSLAKLKFQVGQILETTESCMSTHRPASELNKFNRSITTNWQRISTDSERVIAAALEVQLQSGGAFNCTTSPLVAHWGFGSNPKRGNGLPVPVSEQLLATVSDSGIELLPGRIRKRNPQACLDLNAIAKGDAIDQIASLLRENNIHHYLIEIGGEISVAGYLDGKDLWQVGLENPERGLIETLRLTNQSIATSGDYTDYYFYDGRRYSHLMNPQTGKPVGQDLAMVTVISDTAMLADAWATALMVMGVVKGLSFAEDFGIKAGFVERQHSGFKMTKTEGFRQFCHRRGKQVV